VTAEAATTVDIRAAALSDVPAIREILVAHGNDGAVVIADIVGPYLVHLLGRGRAMVAVIDEVIVGFGAAVDAGRAVHLADLFVRPDRLGQGIGKALLSSVLAGADRRTTFASEDPRALPLYVRAGMQPLWPSLYTQGPSSAVPAPASSVETAPAEPGELSALEAAWTGFARSADHAYWAGMAGSDGFVVRADGAIAAFGYGRTRQAVPIRVLDRLVIHPDADAIAVLFAALRRAGQGGPVLVSLLGPNPALRPLLEAGFRVVDRDEFLASDPAVVDPFRFIPSPGML
jgi:GNAT superfamily N-acetyltransferase